MIPQGQLLRTPRVVITQTIAPERAVNADANLAHLLELGFWRFNFSRLLHPVDD